MKSTSIPAAGTYIAPQRPQPSDTSILFFVESYMSRDGVVGCYPSKKVALNARKVRSREKFVSVGLNNVWFVEDC